MAKTSKMLVRIASLALAVITAMPAAADIKLVQVAANFLGRQMEE